MPQPRMSCPDIHSSVVRHGCRGIYQGCRFKGAEIRELSGMTLRLAHSQRGVPVTGLVGPRIGIGGVVKLSEAFAQARAAFRT